MKYLFLFCSDREIDPVAPDVFERVKMQYRPYITSMNIGGKPALEAIINGNQFFFAETRDIASAIYPEIAADINSQFGDVNMVGVINWHAGANAPPKIFCAHSTAEVHMGIFGSTSGQLLSAILLAIESERKSAGLADFKTIFEASHWSGTMYGRSASELLKIKPPVFDIEIGSFPDDWSHSIAQEVLASALGKIPEFCEIDKPRALFLGGTHFEPSATEMVFQSAIIEHHLPNQWLVSGEYHLQESEEKIVSAAKSCLLSPQLIVYHAGLKAVYKETARKAAEALGIPCLSHKQVRAANWKETMMK